MHTLAVILPVYNEKDAIESVFQQFLDEFESIGITDFHIHAYNDGSKDDSLAIMQKFASMHPQIIVHDKKNSGHGPTILKGYVENCQDYEWIFQTDSDGELLISEFHKLWENKDNYDFLVGIRQGYHASEPLPRKIVSFISRLSVRVFYKKSIWDVNTAYRLMRCSAFAKVFQTIPADTFAPNVIISGMAGVLNLRCFECDIPYKPRVTGCGSISKLKLFKIAFLSFRQTISFALSKKRSLK